jgi:hypothetical protein
MRNLSNNACLPLVWTWAHVQGLRPALGRLQGEAVANPAPGWIKEMVWKNVVFVDSQVPGLKGLAESITSEQAAWQAWFQLEEPHLEPLPAGAPPWPLPRRSSSSSIAAAFAHGPDCQLPWPGSCYLNVEVYQHCLHAHGY